MHSLRVLPFLILGFLSLQTLGTGIFGFRSAHLQPSAILNQSSSQDLSQVPLKILPRVRPACAVRLGGVYTLGLGERSAPFEDSARLDVALSAENAKWIPDNCDVISLSASNLTPDIFRAMMRAQPLFTPLLYVYASTLYEQPDHSESVGGWEPRMANWTLRGTDDREIVYPERGGHWMDFDSAEWAHHWRDQVVGLVHRYGAQGVVAAELPVDNTFVLGKLKKYRSAADRIKATSAWLMEAHQPGRFLLIPAALGFDALVGHATLPPPPGADASQLAGRLWDETYPITDGAWVEGWVRPYWADAPVSEAEWDRQLAAADRAGRNDQVFIAGAAYSNTAELEYALASYLLIVHRQGRFVFQPMPIVKGQRRDAGFSLAVLRSEAKTRARYFNVVLGLPEQERHPIETEGGNVWRRAFQLGVVYVNSTDYRKMTVSLGSKMRRLDGTEVKRVVLPPHSGVTLLYTNPDLGR